MERSLNLLEVVIAIITNEIGDEIFDDYTSLVTAIFDEYKL